MINWVWHAFCDPDAPDDAFVNSTTIFEGEEFIFAEEYHVVHHATPGLHWTRYGAHYEAALARGEYDRALILAHCNIFHVGALILLQDYAGLAALVWDPRKVHDRAQLPGLLKARLRHTCW